MHVEKWAEWLTLLRVRAKPQHISVGIFHLHLVRPGIVRGWMADLGPAFAIFRRKRVSVADSDPGPGSRMPLILLAQEEMTAATGDRGETGASLPIDLETECVHVICDAGRHARHAEDRSGAVEGIRKKERRWLHAMMLAKTQRSEAVAN